MLSHASKFGGVGLVLLLGAASAVFACSSGGDDDDERPSAGSNSGGNAGSGTGGSNGGASAGTATGGGSGSGGAPMGFACPGIKPTSTDITDFTKLMPSDAPMWGAAPATDAFYGGLFSYGAPQAIPVTDVSEDNLHITGKVSDYSGAGLYVSYCTDASKYQGVRFKIKGDAGPTKKMRFAVQTNSNLYPDPMAMKGICQAAEDKKFIDCDHPGYGITVDSVDTEKEIEVTWDKLAGGKPASAATTTGKDIVGFSWIFTWATGTTPYDVDITIDDVAFIGEDTGGGGAGAGGDTGAGGEPGAGGAK